MVWLQKQVTGHEQIVFLIRMFLFTSLLTLFMGSLILMAEQLFHIHLLSVTSHRPNLTTNVPVMFLVIIVGTGFEEFFFRLPLALVARFSKQTSVVVAAMIILSVTFGWLHGTVWNIPIQGVAGVMLSIVFLKCGGFSVREKGWRGALSGFGASWAIHAGFDLMLATILLVRGQHFLY